MNSGSGFKNFKVGSPYVYKNPDFESPMGLFDSTFRQNSGSSKGKDLHHADRFIPSRVASNLNNIFINELVNNDIQEKENQQQDGDDLFDLQPLSSQPTQQQTNYQNNKNYSNLLQQQILGQISLNTSHLGSQKGSLGHDENGHNQQISPNKIKQQKIFKFNSERKNNLNNIKNIENNSFFMNAKLSDENQYNPNMMQNIYEKNYQRKINKQPYKVLDAPSLQDDFYLNLLDWSSENFIAVGLVNEVYIWSACNSKVTKLCELPEEDNVCSVGWSQSGTHLAVGNNYGDVMIYDVCKQKIVRQFDGHHGRVGSISFNGYLLASGSRDRNILIRDVRQPDQYIGKYEGHKQEICGLKWSFDEQMLASGGNDNKLFIWSLKTGGELTRFSQHQAAVKAIGWSPHQHNILASGGGTADRTIRFWNTHNLQQQSCIDTGSQVCNLMFSKTVNEVVSTHGYSLNQIIVWKYGNMQKLATLSGHTLRVLYLAMSPCGQNIVTGAGDETLRFWNVFPTSKKIGMKNSNLCNIELR